MKINAYNKAGISFDDEEITTKFAEQLPECLDGCYEIDYSKCLIDYDATSRITDAVLEKLKPISTPRKLIFVFNIPFQEHLLLRWIFRGSKLLGLDKGDVNDNEVKRHVIDYFRNNNIELLIRIVNPENSKELRVFTYEQ